MDTEFKLGEDFPPVSYEQWRAVVEADLRGASFEQNLVTHSSEGIDIQPLYARRDELDGADPFGLPGAPPFVRGSRAPGAVHDGWDLRQEYADPDPTAARRAILDDLTGGVTSLHLRLDAAARGGFDPDDMAPPEVANLGGIMLYDADDLDELLAEVHLPAVGVSLEAGAAFLPAAAILAAVWRRHGVSPQQARAAFNADPLTVLAREGELPYTLPAGLALLVDLANRTTKNYPLATAVGVDTSPYHHAGATAAQDITFGVATGVEYLRAMTAAGLDIDEAARQILFSFSLGTHHFLAICKLRAARELWSRIVEASGGSPAAGAMRIHTRTSRRLLTRRDPYVNLLRNTVSIFAAGAGGADSITSVPFDLPLGPPDDFSRRIARNTLHILQDEGHLNRVVDPPGGSWFLDRLTQDIADKSWSVFQEIERQGGMATALTSGWIAAQIDSASAVRAKDIVRRKEAITGVSEFPDAREERPGPAPPDVDRLRAAAARRIAERRKKGASAVGQAFLPAGSVGISTAGTALADKNICPTEVAITAAAAGASIGQLAEALGFHRDEIKIPPIELRAFADEG